LKRVHAETDVREEPGHVGRFVDSVDSSRVSTLVRAKVKMKVSVGAKKPTKLVRSPRVLNGRLIPRSDVDTTRDLFNTSRVHNRLFIKVHEYVSIWFPGFPRRHMAEHAVNQVNL